MDLFIFCQIISNKNKLVKNGAEGYINSSTSTKLVLIKSNLHTPIHPMQHTVTY